MSLVGAHSRSVAARLDTRRCFERSTTLFNAGETVCKGNPPSVDSEALRDVSRGSTAHLSQFLSEGLLDISVSNPLVQFLSPLQLQGYASRLIGLYSLRTVEDLVSCVTCETDVERLLGDQSSGQQQRDLWRAVCRWRRASGRRRRSTEKSLRCQKTPALDDATSSGAVCAGEREFMDVTDNLVHCSPSQLMRQLAFRRSERKCSAESSHLKLDDGPAACSISPHPVTKGTDILSDYVPNEVPYVALSSRDTASLTSSLSVASSPNRWSSKRYCRERLPFHLCAWGWVLLRVHMTFWTSTGICLRTRPLNRGNVILVLLLTVLLYQNRHSLEAPVHEKTLCSVVWSSKPCVSHVAYPLKARY
ncbi:hypothetical protein ERJ75_000955300 [Trypanosoma vivax]|nr:hypothetical protein ERJ75_000955300 [Trypanosoma vivax]